MLQCCNWFNVIGTSNGDMVLVGEEHGVKSGYLVQRPMLTSFSMCCNNTLHDTMYGDRFVIPGMMSSEMIFKAGEVTCIPASDIDTIYDPVAQKSVLELIKVINGKLNGRKS